MYSLVVGETQQLLFVVRLNLFRIVIIICAQTAVHSLQTPSFLRLASFCLLACYADTLLVVSTLLAFSHIQGKTD